MLTTEQLKSAAVKRTTLISSAVGIAVGCLLGMLPLLFMDDDRGLKQIFNEIDIDEKMAIKDRQDKSQFRPGIKVVYALTGRGGTGF